MNKPFFRLALASVLCLSAGCATNPITGKRELMLIPEEQDVEIGRKYAPEIEKQMGGKIPDPAIQTYVNTVGQKVAAVSQKPDIEYHFAALQDKNVNALALPGGFIFITRGMLQSLQSEAQLAGILAHEVVHVVARDSANAMSKEIGLSILLSAVTTENTPGSVQTVANLSNQIMGLRYSRTDERHADVGAIGYLLDAGYNPHAMIETMQILANQNKSRPIEFLSTHPLPETRQKYLAEAIQNRNFNIADTKVGKEEYRRAILDQLSKLPPTDPN